jgi:hypothetical protein
MYLSPNETLCALERAGYFTDLRTATTVYLAGKIHRPIMLEGPAGAGKTELASSVALAYGEPLIRLQCYQGINEEKAIGQYDRSLQELYVLLMSKSDQTPDWAEIKREVTSRSYFMAGPLLEAIEQERPCVLLIDEIASAFRHAQGCSIEVEVDYATWELRLHIRDDGRGIDPNILKAGRPGHIGLASMRERAERVGGQLDIISGPGAGTEIELRVPAPKAYRGILVESPWRRLWHSTLGRL